MLRLSTAVTDLNCFTTFFRVTLANWHPFLQNKDLSMLPLNRVRGKPSVYRHHDSGHETRRIRQQPDESADQVVRLSVAAHGSVRDHLAAARQQLARVPIDVQELQLFGHEKPRGKGVDPHPGAGKMNRQPAGEVAYGGFGSRV